MDGPGLRLKQARERLNLRYRDVEDASIQIAKRHNNDEFIIALSRLSDIENKGTLPSLYRLYSLCTIYRLDINEVMEWYGIPVSAQAVDAASIEIGRTHTVSIGSGGSWGEVLVPLALDPGFDWKKTTFLSRMIQRWGKLPLSLLSGLDIKNLRFAFVGSEDWSMYPLIPPESLILIDESQKRIVNAGWNSEYDRPIYLIEHRTGFFIGWCTLTDRHLVIQPHPASMYAPQVFPISEIDVIGQVTGVAMRLGPMIRRPDRA